MLCGGCWCSAGSRVCCCLLYVCVSQQGEEQEQLIRDDQHQPTSTARIHTPSKSPGTPLGRPQLLVGRWEGSWPGGRAVPPPYPALLCTVLTDRTELSADSCCWPSVVGAGCWPPALLLLLIAVCFGAFAALCQLLRRQHHHTLAVTQAAVKLDILMQASGGGGCFDQNWHTHSNRDQKRARVWSVEGSGRLQPAGHHSCLNPEHDKATN